jgi:hypothetical protein
MELTNSIFAAARAHIRYLSSSHFYPFFLIKSMLQNLKALWRDRHGRDDVEEVDLASFFFSIFPCGCRRCVASNIILRHHDSSSSEKDEISAEPAKGEKRRRDAEI